MRRLQSIQNLILENFKYQFKLTKRGFNIDGIVYGYIKTTEYTKFDYRKLQKSILTYKKGLSY